MKKRRILIAGTLVAISAAFAAFSTSVPSLQTSATTDSAFARARAKALSQAAQERAKARAKARAQRKERAEKAAAAKAAAAAEAAAAESAPALAKPAADSTPARAAPAPVILEAAPPVTPLATPKAPKKTAPKRVATRPPVQIPAPVLAPIRPPAPVATVAAPVAAPANGARSRGIPQGFEQWFAPQKTAVDLYYGGRFLMTTLVEYTVDNITFLNPPEVAAKLPGLRAPEDVSLLLADAQPTNADKVCIRPNQPLCGRLEPTALGVIFDERRFRADVFLHPSLLLEAQQLGSRYLPEPSHEQVTLVQNLSTLFSGSSEGDNRFSLFGRTRVGHGRGHGFSNWVSTDANALSVDELGYTHDFKDVQVSAGIFEPSIDALRAIPRYPIMGVSVARSLLTRTDLESTMASPIELFIPVRGRVDIFRDGRLISTGFYEAGNQRIDTSHLPGGAYNIDIVITDVTGSTRTIQQLFIKSSLMPPPGEPLWFVDAGQIMQRAPLENLPQDRGVQELRAGYRWRQKSWLGFGTAGAVTTDESLVELSTGILLGWLEGSAEVFGSSHGGSGFGLRGVTHRGKLTASASLQETSADEASIPPGDYRLITRDHSLTTLFLSHPLWQGMATASLSQSEQYGNSTKRFTLGFSRTIQLGGNHTLQLQAEAGDEDGNAMTMLTLQWRNTRGNWSDNAHLRLSQRDANSNSDTVSVGAATTWTDGDRFVDDVQLGVRTEVGDQNTSLTLDGQHRSAYGRGSASLTASDNNGAGQALASLGYDTSFVMGESGKFAFGGGPNQGEAAVLVDLRSAPEAVLEVNADGQRQFITRGGSNRALTLAPYHQYRIRIKDSGLALSQLDDKPRDVTLYPGHVVNMDWAIKSIQVLVGRIVTEDGEPLANARIDGAEGISFTDEDGFIQTEIVRGTTTLEAKTASSTCTVRLPASAGGEPVLRLMSLRCVDAKGKEPPATTGNEGITESPTASPPSP